MHPGSGADPTCRTENMLLKAGKELHLCIISIADHGGLNLVGPAHACVLGYLSGKCLLSSLC